MSTIITNVWTLITNNSGVLVQKTGNEPLYICYTDGTQPVDGVTSVFCMKSSGLETFNGCEDKSIWFKAGWEDLHVTYEILE